MEFEMYAKAAARTAIYPGRDESLIYPAMGLNGEAGEFIELVKKSMRGSRHIPTLTTMDETLKARLMEEMGDVLWYVAACCHEMGVSMDEVAMENIHKLWKRYPTIGDGRS